MIELALKFAPWIFRLLPFLRSLAPAWVIWLAVAGVFAGLVIQSAMLRSALSAERAAHAQTVARHAQLVADAQRAAADEEARRRRIETELRDAQEVHAEEAQALHAAVDNARARAAVESGRVRDAARAAAERARAQCAAATVADLREAAGDPIGVLADVLGRADERAGLLADLADRRYIAGRACEREYDRARDALRSMEPGR